jgi:hypothetical protein
LALDCVRAYGLTCAVDFEWAWCPAAASECRPDLRLSLNDPLRFEQRTASDYQLQAQRLSSSGGASPTVRVERGCDGSHRVAYADGAEFIIDAGVSEVIGVSRSELTLEDLLIYVQGPILGFVQRLRGVTCLHASAVVVDGAAIAVVGDAGLGKSTSAAAFARLGLPVLTDDVLPLGDHGDSFDVQPGLPRVLLWPASVESLFGDAEALPRIVSSWDKRYLDLTRPPYRFAREPAPLAAIYILGDRLAPGLPAQISALEGTQALLRLIANTYSNDFIDANTRAREFEVLGRIVRQLPIRRVRAPDDRGSVTRVCETILEDFHTLR